MGHFVAALVCLLVITPFCTQACESPYIEVMSSCYHIVAPEVWVDQPTAQAACESEGSTLMEYYSKEELEAIRQIIRSTREGRRMSRYWIGGRRESINTDVWTWGLDGDLIHPFDIVWGRSEPNNKAGNETCMNMLKLRAHKLNDGNCDKLGGYICKKLQECSVEDGKSDWQVIQRRMDGSVDFFRDWDAYRHGFGDLEGEFWIGNHLLSMLTNYATFELHIDLWDWNDNHRCARYTSFSLTDKFDFYRLALGTYSGNAGDSLTYSNGMPFTTKDHDNDDNNGNCASLYRGAWWYGPECHEACLNGFYYDGGVSAPLSSTVVWKDWLGLNYSLKKTEMKIRPVPIDV